MIRFVLFFPRVICYGKLNLRSTGRLFSPSLFTFIFSIKIINLDRIDLDYVLSLLKYSAIDEHSIDPDFCIFKNVRNEIPVQTVFKQRQLLSPTGSCALNSEAV